MRLRAYQKLFLSYTALIALVVTALSVGAESMLRRNLEQGVERHLDRELRLAVTFYDGLPHLTADSAADLLAARSGHRVTIIARDGTVVGESTREGAALRGMQNHHARPEVVQARVRGIGRSVRPSATLRTSLLYAAILSERGEVVRVAVPLAEVDAAVSRVQRGIFGVGAVAVLLASVFSLGFSIAITRPLRRVTEAALEAARGNLSIRLRERRRDELGELSGALDTLAEQLQRRVQQLEEERAEMQALIDSMSEGVIALGPDGMVRRANPAAHRMFALQRRAHGIPPEAIARRPDFLRLVRRALGGDQVPPTEFNSDGRSILATAHPLPDGGAVVVFLDLTALRRLEGIRRDFVVNASHELKTPLTVIRGYSETLLDPDLPPDLARQFTETVKANADRLQRIVDDLLDLSRIESGSWTTQPEVLGVVDLASEAWTEAAEGRSDLPQLRWELEPGAQELFADPGAVRQVFANLFANSLRYTPPHGTVTVSARPVAGSADWIEVAVQDTGTGIPATHLPRIFERFYRVDPARSRAAGGTGLGLAIVKHLIEAHGGRVRAESRIGEGTTIRFTLPAPRR